MWIATLVATLAIALAYFLAAQLGLSLLAKPSEVAVFWPASGIAAAILIVGGRRVGVALVVGVVVGTVAANLMSERSPPTSVLKGLCNAGEAVLLAWLLHRWFGRPFTFCDLRRVGGFFTAVVIAVSISAIGGAATMTTLQSAAPFWDAWRTWFLSDAVGILVIAPLLIELGQLRSQRRSRAELIEGAGTVVLIALASIYAVTFPTGTWLSLEPDAVAFVVLLWLTARNQQLFAIAGAFAVSISVIAATTYGIGHFGDVTLPIVERAQASRVVATMVTAFTLVLSALFAERRRSEVELKQSNNRLQLALDCAELGTWSLQLSTGRFENDVRDRRIHGHGPEAPPKTLAEMRSQVHPDDLSKLDASFRESGHAGGSCRAEYRLAPRTDQERAGRERWVTLEGTVVRRADGCPEQLLGVTHDITERKLAEEALRTSEERLRRVSDNADVGLIRCSHDWHYLSANPAYAKIVGKPLDQIVGLPMAEVIGAEAVEAIRPYVERVLRGEYLIYEAKVPYAGSGSRYLHVSYTPDTDAAGQIVGWVACITDISERKKAELALTERTMQLDLAGKAALVGSFGYDVDSEKIQISEGYAAIHGFPEGTTEIERRQWQAGVHPDDADGIEAVRRRTFDQRGPEYGFEYRIVRRNGEVRWIESRTFVSYSRDRRPERVVGVNIDVTERKRAEVALQASEAKFAGILAIAGDAIISLDGKQRITLFNEAAERLFGYSRGEMIGQPMDLLIPSRFRLLHQQHIERFTLGPDIPRRMAEQREVPGRRKNGEEFPVEASISKVKIAGEWVCTVVLRDITERKHAEERQRVLLAELDHRVKNVLATVSTVAARTMDASSSMKHFVASLDGRIRSMARTHELLSAAQWHGISVLELVRRELAPYATRANTEINGPAVMLKAEAGQAMAMVIHELATNAAKYGALSTRKGRVSIRWDRRVNGRPRSDLVLEWQEIGGPPVNAPSNSGYGTSTIRDLIPYEFDGTVDLVFPTEGVQCHLKLPAAWLSDSPDPYDPGSRVIADAAAK